MGISIFGAFSLSADFGVAGVAIDFTSKMEGALSDGLLAASSFFGTGAALSAPNGVGVDPNKGDC